MALTFFFGMVVSARAQSGDLDALNQQVVQLYRQGKYPEATKISKRSLALAEKKFGPDHPNVATSLIILAGLYHHQGRYGEAEPLYQRSLDVTFSKSSNGREVPRWSGGPSVSC